MECAPWSCQKEAVDADLGETERRLEDSQGRLVSQK